MKHKLIMGILLIMLISITEQVQAHPRRHHHRHYYRTVPSVRIFAPPVVLTHGHNYDHSRHPRYSPPRPKHYGPGHNGYYRRWR